MKIIYRLGAELLSILHFVIVFLGLMIGLLWEPLFFVYTLIFVLGIPSWIFLRRCFLTDFENHLRIKSGQDLSHVRESFIGYWGVKVFGQHTPSNKVIFWIIAGFYVIITPVWLYTIYTEYLL